MILGEKHNGRGGINKKGNIHSTEVALTIVVHKDDDNDDDDLVMTMTMMNHSTEVAFTIS